MNTDEFTDHLVKLSKASLRNFTDPGEIEWPAEADAAAWHFTPELISIYGTPAWDALDDAAQRRLSLFEAVNFFSLNVHGEKFLISEISRHLYTDEHPELSRYLLHFVEEETKHMMYFSDFCNRYAGKVYRDRTLQLDHGLESDLATFLLYARIYLFEEIVDEYNRIMAADERLAPIAREINRMHHVEESRHLAFGRKYLRYLVERDEDEWDAWTRTRVREHLNGFLDLAWKQYYNPDVYEDAGLSDAFGTWRSAYDDPSRQRHRTRINRKRLGLLRELELLEDPS